MTNFSKKQLSDTLKRNIKIPKSADTASLLEFVQPYQSSDLYIYMADASLLQKKRFSKKLTEFTSPQISPSQLRKILEGSFLIGVGSAPYDFENAHEILIVKQTEFYQDVVVNRRVFDDQPHYQIVNRLIKVPLSHSGNLLVQKAANTLITARDYQDSVNRGLKVFYPPIILRRYDVLDTCTHLTTSTAIAAFDLIAFSSEDESLSSFSPILNSISNGSWTDYTHVSSHQGFVIGISDFTKGHQSARVTEQMCTRPVVASISEGTTYSIHLPDGPDAAMADLIRFLASDDGLKKGKNGTAFWSNARQTQEYKDILGLKVIGRNEEYNIDSFQ